ncbi:response regulator [Aquibium carbonis]|uniref:Response regulator n=1 Tax=Aquibium carbonis TaxID=2495581 RepID=A0A429YXI0_9HYPH|nr:response regulator [Aquibium carbonis]RST86150.1 response regulator [Aquibium carbonis]
MSRILIVEDDEPVRALAARALERDGHVVETAEDGEMGLERIRASNGAYDLVVSDIRMPAMDGIEMAKAAAALFPGLRIMLITGYADMREHAEELSSIILEILPKPFTLDQIRTKVRQHAS